MRYRLSTLVLAAVVVLGGGVVASAQPAAPAAGTWSAADCQTCHETAVGAAFAKTKHAQARPELREMPRERG